MRVCTLPRRGFRGRPRAYKRPHMAAGCHATAYTCQWHHTMYQGAINRKRAKWWNVWYFSAKWAQKCRTFRPRVWLASPTMKSSYAYWYIAVVLCTISAFWTVAAVYSADNASQVMKLKAINRYMYVTPLFCRDLCYYLIRKRCYRTILSTACRLSVRNV